MSYFQIAIIDGEPVMFVKENEATVQTYTIHMIALLICLHVARKHGVI